MKICHIANTQGIHDLRWIEALAKKGYDLSVLSFNPISDVYKKLGVAVYSLHEYDQTDNGKKNIERRRKFSKTIGRYLFLKIYNLLPPDWQQLVSMEMYVFKAKKIIERIKPDVIHGHFLTSRGYISARIGFHPIVLTAMGSDILLEIKNSWIAKKMILYAIKKADIIICDAKSTAESLTKEGANFDKVRCFPRGTNLRCFKPFNNPDIRERLGWKNKKILIMTRRFEPVYGIRYFIEALPQIICEEPDARVVFVGSGSLQCEILNRISELKLDDYVHFADLVSDETMADYLNAADIYISTSLSDGTSNSLLEAMACGLPVILSDLPANLEWVKNGFNGYLVPIKNTISIARQTINLLKDEQARKNMGERNLQIARERANWDNNLSKLEAVYADLVSRWLAKKTIEEKIFKRFFKKTLFFISPDIFLFQKKAELHNMINRIKRGFINHHIVKCNICNWDGNRFDAIGTGSYIRYNAVCPLCGSVERHRIIAAILNGKNIVKKNSFFLDVAPFKGFGHYLIGKHKVRYFSIDISDELCQIKMDLQAIAFHDNSFDTILCSHVLEHIQDDILAMRELRRILKQDGICIILIPFNQNLPATREFGFSDPKLSNHVRAYGSDMLERIKLSGFNVEPLFYQACKSDCTKYGVEEAGEHIFFCRK